MSEFQYPKLKPIKERERER